MYRNLCKIASKSPHENLVLKQIEHCANKQTVLIIYVAIENKDKQEKNAEKNNENGQKSNRKANSWISDKKLWSREKC